MLPLTSGPTASGRIKQGASAPGQHPSPPLKTEMPTDCDGYGSPAPSPGRARAATGEDQGAAKHGQAGWKLQDCCFPDSQVLPESLSGMGWDRKGRERLEGFGGERQVQGFSLQASACWTPALPSSLRCALDSSVPPRSLWPQSHLPAAKDPGLREPMLEGPSQSASPTGFAKDDAV